MQRRSGPARYDSLERLAACSHEDFRLARRPGLIASRRGSERCRRARPPRPHARPKLALAPPAGRALRESVRRTHPAAPARGDRLPSKRQSAEGCSREIPRRNRNRTLADRAPDHAASRSSGQVESPPIESAGALSEWLAVSPSELLWFADLKGLTAKLNSPLLQHYHYRVLRKPSGDFRLIEIPKPRIKDIQRQILFHILNKIPPHPVAHGFLRETFHSHVRRSARRPPRRASHGSAGFLPHLRRCAHRNILSNRGISESVATICWPDSAPPQRRARRGPPSQRAVEYTAAYAARDFIRARTCRKHGAPTARARQHLAYRTDCRLTGLAKSAGAQYTRYADDLAFSGDRDFEKCVDRFSRHGAAILLEEGFSVNIARGLCGRASGLLREQ